MKAEIVLSGSKSITNRLLIINALYRNVLNFENESTSNDTQVLKKALAQNSGLIDIHHAGTAMRFLTAYFATQNNEVVELTGSERMKERPIGILVDS